MRITNEPSYFEQSTIKLFKTRKEALAKQMAVFLKCVDSQVGTFQERRAICAQFEPLRNYTIRQSIDQEKILPKTLLVLPAKVTSFDCSSSRDLHFLNNQINNYIATYLLNVRSLPNTSTIAQG